MLQQAINAYHGGGAEKVLDLPTQVLKGVGPKEQAFLSGQTLGTLRDVRNLDITTLDGPSTGRTQAQNATLTKIRDKVLGATMTVFM